MNPEENAGELLAERYPAEADIVIGVPDSGLDAALGFAEKAGIPYGIGLIKTNISEEPLFLRDRGNAWIRSGLNFHL